MKPVLGPKSTEGRDAATRIVTMMLAATTDDCRAQQLVAEVQDMDREVLIHTVASLAAIARGVIIKGADLVGRPHDEAWQDFLLWVASNEGSNSADS